MVKRVVFYNLVIIINLFLMIFSNGVDAKCTELTKKSISRNYFQTIKDRDYGVDEKNLIVEIPKLNVKLYYDKEYKEEGTYRGFVLKGREMSRWFLWENVTSPTHKPKLMVGDLDQDGSEEIVIELCKGYGSGLFEGEVHVIKTSSLEEILVEEPVIILYKNIKIKEFPESFEIMLKNKKVILDKKKMPYDDYSNLGIGWGDDKTYEVKDNRLYAKVYLIVSTIRAGELIVKYKYKDGILQMDSIDFLSYIN